MVVLSLIMVRRNMGALKLERRNSESTSKSASQMPVKKESGKKVKAKGKIMPLYKYLVISKEQYDEFSEFLTSCFALENLLFFVKATTFRHLVSEINSDRQAAKRLTDTNLNISNVAEMQDGIPSFTPHTIESPVSTTTTIQLSADLDSPKSIEDGQGHTKPKRQTTMEKVFAMEFNYLEDLMKEKHKATDSTSIRDIVSNMYDMYISVEGEYQVNIPSEQRERIETFMKDEHEVSEYLTLFDEAIEEVYGMLTNVYRFQFKADSRYVVN